MNPIYRQGDVVLIRTDTIPDHGTTVAREHGRLVLQHGEVTGHAHAIHDTDVELLTHEQLEDRFLRVLADGGVDLLHEEHAPVHLPKGDYIVRIQREYSPEAIRRVAD